MADSLKRYIGHLEEQISELYRRQRILERTAMPSKAIDDAIARYERQLKQAKASLESREDEERAPTPLRPTEPQHREPTPHRPTEPQHREPEELGAGIDWENWQIPAAIGAVIIYAVVSRK